ncbi:MAG: hypothetical protein KKB50_13280 [Planctomycetes bacterium]|nr:hypothetical protein [Planctomycetota bacterium]
MDTDDDGDYSDETTLITSAAVDDDWSAGCVGLFRYAGNQSTQQFDDVKVGYDNNADADILDAGDEIQIQDDFNSNVMSLSFDNNGSLTDDGVYKFVYDACNRLAGGMPTALRVGVCMPTQTAVGMAPGGETGDCPNAIKQRRAPR